MRAAILGFQTSSNRTWGQPALPQATRRAKGEPETGSPERETCSTTDQNSRRTLTCARRALVPSGNPEEAVGVPRPTAGLMFRPLAV